MIQGECDCYLRTSDLIEETLRQRKLHINHSRKAILPERGLKVNQVEQPGIPLAAGNAVRKWRASLDG